MTDSTKLTFVPSVPPLGSGTVGQATTEPGHGWDNGGTDDIKALARKVLQRRRVGQARDNGGTSVGQNCPRPQDHVGQAHRVSDWTPEEWAYRFHERAGFLEHDCHQGRQEAEQRALHELEGHWLALHPMPPGAPESGCVHCRTGAGAADLLPHVAAGKGHFWLHQRCWSGFEKARRAEARAALAKLIPALPDKDGLEELLEDLGR